MGRFKQANGREANGPALRAAREAAGLDRRAVARHALIDPSFVSRMESGARRFIDPVIISTLAGLYGVPEESLWKPADSGGDAPAVTG